MPTFYTILATKKQRQYNQLVVKRETLKFQNSSLKIGWKHTYE